MLSLLGVHLAALLALLAAALLGLLAALSTGRQELAGLRVAGSLFRELMHALAELLGVAPVLRSLVSTAALLARPAGFITRRFLRRRDEPLLLLALRGLLLNASHLLAALLSVLLGRSTHLALLSAHLADLLGLLTALLLATVALGLVSTPVDRVR